MLELNLPPFDKKVIERDGKLAIFDIIRRRFVALTPEEWVRQHFVHFLIGHKGYPQSLIAAEVQLKQGSMSRRCDTVVYDRSLTPRVIVEYKAPTVNITQRVFDQICRYNMTLQVDYLIVSNGIAHYCCQMHYDRHTYEFVSDIPDYSEIIGDKSI